MVFSLFGDLMAYSVFNWKKSGIYFLGFAGSVFILFLVWDFGIYRAAKTIVVQEIPDEKQTDIGFTPEACGDDQVFVLLRLRGLRAASEFENGTCMKIKKWSILQGNVVLQSNESGTPKYYRKMNTCRFRNLDIVSGQQYFLKAENGFDEKYLEGIRAEVWCASEHPYSRRIVWSIVAVFGSIISAILFL